MLWKFDRQALFRNLDNYMFRFFKNQIIIQILYGMFIIAVCFTISLISDKNSSDAVTAFLVIDISNAERKNLDRRGKVYFYDSISLISKSIVCGFIAPLLYILLFGNIAGIIYMLIYNIGLDRELFAYNILSIITAIIPAIIAELFLYIIYVCRNRKISIDFKGDYFINCITRPLLNADVMAAYVEAVNFYYYFGTNSDVEYIKSYGDYNNKINEVCIKDYLGIAYGICMITFIVFYFMMYMK